MTSVRIDSWAVSQGTLTQSTFSLLLIGRGFGLRGLSYDVNRGEGVGADRFTVGLQSADGSAMAEAVSWVLLSPRRLEARFTLARPMAAGAYNVVIVDGGRVIAQASERLTTGRPAGPVLDGGGSLDATGVTAPGPRPDAGVAVDPDAGLDAGVPDSGAFAIDSPFRRPIMTDSPILWPASATIRVPVPHRDLVRSGESAADGADLVVLQGSSRLDMQFADIAALNTNALELIVRLRFDVRPGTDSGLMLYSGNPAVAGTVTDEVFAFVERFDVDLDMTNNDQTAWHNAGYWYVFGNDRTAWQPRDEVGSFTADGHPYENEHQTLATYRMSNVRTDRATPNTRYEMQLWLSGIMFDSEIVALAQHHRNDEPALAMPFAPQEYVTAPPDILEGYVERGQTVRWRGWRLTGGWDRYEQVRVMFEPRVDEPSIHLRHLSNGDPRDNAPDHSEVFVDDWWVRLAVYPEPRIWLGPPEHRMR